MVAMSTSFLTRLGRASLDERGLLRIDRQQGYYSVDTFPASGFADAADGVYAYGEGRALGCGPRAWQPLEEYCYCFRIDAQVIEFVCQHLHCVDSKVREMVLRLLGEESTQGKARGGFTFRFPYTSIIWVSKNVVVPSVCYKRL